MSADGGLAALEARLRHDLEILDFPRDPWLPPTRHPSGRHVHDVVIVGGGQAGLALSFALRREKIADVRVVDRAPRGREGPWMTFARMPQLRTPKHLIGPDLGIPSLTFRAWFEAQPELGGWDALLRIPRPMWMDYLDWYRRVLAIEVENGVEIASIDGEGELVALTTTQGERLLARKAVFANGMEGAGGWSLPEELVAGLPRHVYAHSAATIDFAALRGKRVGVLGYGSSAADNAACALEAGAAGAELFCRRAEVPKVEARAWIENNGFLRHFFELDDARRWWIMRRYWQTSAPAPPWSLELASSYPGFRANMGSAWLATRFENGRVVVTTTQGEREFDFLIFATGLTVDLRHQAEFAAIVDRVATWADRYTPPPGEECESLAVCPYLGRGYELVEKDPGRAPFLRHIHLFNWGSTPSLGISASSITGMKFGVSRLTTAITRDFYLAFADEHARAFPWRESRGE